MGQVIDATDIFGRANKPSSDAGSTNSVGLPFEFTDDDFAQLLLFYENDIIQPTRAYSDETMKAVADPARITLVEATIRQENGSGSRREKGALRTLPATLLHVSGIGAVMFFGEPEDVLEHFGLPLSLLDREKPVRPRLGIVNLVPTPGSS